MTAPSPTADRIDWAAFALPEESRELIATARSHFARLTGPDDLRAVIDGGPRPALWSTLADHGYTMIGLPEELDGLGTRVDLAALLEEAGAALLPAPLMSHSAAIQTLLAAGIRDSGAPEQPTAMASARASGLFAFDAADATAAVTVEAHEGGTVVRRHEIRDAAAQTQRDVDPTRPSLRFDREALALSHEVAVDADPDAVLASARICVAADLIGVAQRALDGGIAHALTRRQFDRVIGSFQAVKHLLANAHVSVERARSLCIGAAVALDVDPLSDRAALLSLLAKAAASDAAAEAAALQVQLLGAMGLTFEADSPLAVRRARHTIPFLGSPSALYARAARRALEGRTER